MGRERQTNKQTTGECEWALSDCHNHNVSNNEKKMPALAPQ